MRLLLIALYLVVLYISGSVALGAWLDSRLNFIQAILMSSYAAGLFLVVHIGVLMGSQGSLPHQRSRRLGAAVVCLVITLSCIALAYGSSAVRWSSVTRAAVMHLTISEYAGRPALALLFTVLAAVFCTLGVRALRRVDPSHSITKT